MGKRVNRKVIFARCFQGWPRLKTTVSTKIEAVIIFADDTLTEKIYHLKWTGVTPVVNNGRGYFLCVVQT